MPVLGVVYVSYCYGICGGLDVPVHGKDIRVLFTVDDELQVGPVVGHGEVSPLIGGEGERTFHAYCNHGVGAYVHPYLALA